MFFKKKEKVIASVQRVNGKGGSTLRVTTTSGVEVVTGVVSIIDRGDIILFAADPSRGGGFVVAKHHFIKAVPE